MSDEIYPIIEPDGEEIFYQNAWRSDLPQTLGDTECFDFNAQPNDGENLVVMRMTGNQLMEMLSALYIGAEFCYPEKYLEIIRPLLSATACPPILEEQDCYEYPTYSSFFRYTPMNPYIEPDEIPEGYETQPMIVNGENGNTVPNYEHFDIIVPSSAITFDVNWWASISGQLPTVEVLVQGAGKAFLKMLTLAQGGLAVITVDNPPDLLDILAGIVTGADNIIDLNQDLVSLPPETAQELIFEVDLVGAGLHTIYIVFLPILDDSLIPIRFGGGFRGVQLCDFVEVPEMGIANIRFEDCNLEVQDAGGVWSVVPGWENWLDCVPSGGGGGGVAAFKATPYAFEAGANIDTTSTTMVQAVASIQEHQYTYSKALIFAECQLSNTNAAGNAFIEVRNDGAQGVRSSVNRVGGNVGEVLYTSAAFEGLDTVNPSEISIYFRANANTARIGQGSRIHYTILEFESADDLEAMFVQDIQYSGGVLQKKLGGVWLNVVDIAALLAPIQTTANNAAAAASAAQSTANNALTVANGAVTVNNTQNTRLNNIEGDLEQVVDIDIPQINLTLANHESRIAALEAALAGGTTWAGYKLGQITDLDLAPTGGRYSSPFSTFDSNPARRWWTPTVNNDIDVFSANAMRLGAAAFVRVAINVENYVSGTFSARINGGQEALLLQNIGSGNIWGAWIPVLPNESADMQIEVSASTGGNTWGLRSITYLLINFNPFTLQILP
jgi:hypothetical protein